MPWLPVWKIWVKRMTLPWWLITFVPCLCRWLAPFRMNNWHEYGVCLCFPYETLLHIAMLASLCAAGWTNLETFTLRSCGICSTLDAFESCLHSRFHFLFVQLSLIAGTRFVLGPAHFAMGLCAPLGTLRLQWKRASSAGAKSVLPRCWHWDRHASAMRSWWCILHKTRWGNTRRLYASICFWWSQYLQLHCCSPGSVLTWMPWSSLLVCLLSVHFLGIILLPMTHWKLPWI